VCRKALVYFMEFGRFPRNSSKGEKKRIKTLAKQRDPG
jgi:hypothetical protein